MINFPISLKTLASYCDGEVIGDGARQITQICSIDNPIADALTFVGTASAMKKIDADSGVIYIVKPADSAKISCGIAHDFPQQAFRQILVALTAETNVPSIAYSASIAPSATIGKGVSIGGHSVIGDGVVLGDNVSIGHGSVIEKNAVIGEQTHIGHRVVIHHDTQVGKACVISEGAIIGGQGFGFSFEGGHWQAIPQIGRVVIGNATHIGANTCIDRGAINDTVIGNNVIIDNLVHIAHNVCIGDGTAMAAGVGIAGSTNVGKYCLLAGQVGVVGHIDIADGVQVNGGSRVLQSITDSGAYAGSFHAMPARKWNRTAVYLKKLESLFKREKSSDKRS